MLEIPATNTLSKSIFFHTNIFEIIWMQINKRGHTFCAWKWLFSEAWIYGAYFEHDEALITVFLMVFPSGTLSPVMVCQIMRKGWYMGQYGSFQLICVFWESEVIVEPLIPRFSCHCIQPEYPRFVPSVSGKTLNVQRLIFFNFLHGWSIQIWICM